jgi:phosphoribosyl 1,2-cyclic phosphodiesterase
MRLLLLGVRGSVPAPGAEFVRYGGQTSCVAVTADGADAPTLVLDAGTGLRALTARLGGAPYRGAILLSHLHWDHMWGLPFFSAGDRAGADIDLYLPAQDGVSARDLLARSMAPPIFPITPEGLLGRWGFHGLEPGRQEIQGFTVTAAEIEHKGGRAYGYRVEDLSGSMAYLPDHSPSAGVSAQTRALLDGVDVLLHDAQFLAAERAVADLYGHATVGDAIALAEGVGAGRLVLFHHSPTRTDDQLDAIAAGLDAAVPTSVAREGDEITVGRP